MPDNVKEENKVEENKSTKVQENEKGGVFKEFDDLKSDVEQGKKDSKVERNTIENILKRADDKVKERKKELFLEKLNKEMEGKVSEPITFDKLTVDQRRDFDNFEIPEDELEKLYNENGTSKEIKDLTEKRNNQLDGLGKQVDEFYKKLEQEISDRQEQLKNTKDEKEKEKIQDEIDKIEGMKNELGAKKEDKSPIRQTLAQAFNNHDEARMNAVNGLMLVYSENIVRKDTDFIDKVVPDKEKEEFAKGNNTKEETLENNEHQQHGQNQAKNGPTAGFAPAEGQGQEVGETKEQEPDAMKLLEGLGYTGQVLNHKSSKDLLDNFVNASEKDQLSILSNSDAKDKIFEAVKKANSRWTPIFAMKFNKTRKALLEKANGPLMRKALESIGKDVNSENLDALNEQFEDALKDYEIGRARKQKEINSLPDGDKKEQLQAELEAFDKEYSALTGANDFRNLTNKELNRFRDRVVNKMSNLFYRDDVGTTYLPTTEEATEIENNQKDFREGLNNNIIDYTKMSDEEIKKYMKDMDKSKGEQAINRDDKQKY